MKTNRHSKSKAATLVAVVVVTIIFGYTALLISGSQGLMLYYRHQIESNESIRQYNADMAQINSGITTGIVEYYQSLSNNANDKVNFYTMQRKNLQDSSNPIVHWASKDMVDLKISLIGFGIIIFLVSIWIFMIKYPKKFFLFTRRIFSPICIIILYSLYIVLFGAARILAIMSNSLDIGARKIKPKKSRKKRKNIRKNVNPPSEIEVTYNNNLRYS